MSHARMVNIDSNKFNTYIYLAGYTPKTLSKDIGAASGYIAEALRNCRISARNLHYACSKIGVDAEKIAVDNDVEYHEEHTLVSYCDRNIDRALIEYCNRSIEALATLRGNIESELGR